ncbi:MAG: hypothetical protein SV377_05520, partial [Halobacteria archaeon]|nr:hypothetical protein [Halobacteria archaeon]
SFLSGAIREVQGSAVETGFLSFNAGDKAFHTAVDLGCEFIAVNHKWATAGYVSNARDHSLKPGIWTVNTAEEISKALNSRPYSITTDRPDVALKLRDG